jgi:hypothetical protein
MKYMFLLFNEEGEANASPEAWTEWMHFEEEATKRVTKVDAAALQPASTATTVCIRNGETILTDGPFVDTKEQLGGYYVFDCRDLDEAIAVARLIPWAPTGHIEVRPLLEQSPGA